ncbi:uncharacterized protein At2g29880-like [Salvia miltiorrhiza]|uniref:uncharacterized protein At2g29880-like n=1 Tax=Salvia miltiorrhiza TaxID=226208 RepID=UPI0025AB64A1|nr:uncharacterized protein At2g29880-like [Salvia miltiorrhiza]
MELICFWYSNVWETGSFESGHLRVNKTDKTRRSWTGKEEDMLLSSLKELVAQGWKFDNGFRAGYLNKLEEAMKKAFPGTDLKGVPHVNSKICAWKKHYNSLVLMLANTGVGFNVNGDHMVNCTDEQWEHIVMKDQNARLMRLKSWPMLDDWKVVFGQDRATGEHAEDLMDAVTDMFRRRNTAEDTPDDVYHVQLDDIENEVVDESASQSKKVDEGASQSKKVDAVNNGNNKKRKARDEMSGVYEALVEISRNTNQRKEVFEHLNVIPGLSLEQRFDICELLAYKQERLEIFLGLPADAKPAYAMRLLEGRSK